MSSKRKYKVALGVIVVKEKEVVAENMRDAYEKASDWWEEEDSTDIFNEALPVCIENFVIYRVQKASEARYEDTDKLANYIYKNCGLVTAEED